MSSVRHSAAGSSWPALVLSVTLAAGARPATAASFGIPPAAGGSPAGYFVLTGPQVGDEFGDKRHRLDLFIEVTGTVPFMVDLYDPGLVSATAGNLDLIFTGAAVGTVAYTLYDPSDLPIASMTFGADTEGAGGTNLAIVPLYTGIVAAGRYRLEVIMVDTPAVDDLDLNSFGVRVPEYDFYSYHFTGGAMDMAGATVSSPVTIYPWVVHSTSGDLVPAEDETGVDVINWDMDSLDNLPPPAIRLETPSDRGANLVPSLHVQQFTTQLRGLNRANLDCSDYGVYELILRDIGDALEGTNDLNVLTAQIVDYVSMVPTTDFPLAPSDPRRPRRLYYPRDDMSQPPKESLTHVAAIVSGPDPPQISVSSVLEVTLTFDNPTAYDLDGIDVTTRLTLDPQFSDPTAIVASGGLIASATGRDIRITGSVAAGSADTVLYRTTLRGTAIGTYYMTGDGTDLNGGARPSDGVYRTPFTSAAAAERFGPICMLRATVVSATCLVTADLVGDTEICLGESAMLDASGTTFSTCFAGVEYRWLAEGLEIMPYPAPAMISVSPVVDTLYTVEARCASLPGCLDMRDLRVTVGAGSAPGDVGNTLLMAREVADAHLYWTPNGAPDYRVRNLDTDGPFDWPTATLRSTLSLTDLVLTGEVPPPPRLRYYEVFAYSCATESSDFAGRADREPSPAVARSLAEAEATAPSISRAVEAPSAASNAETLGGGPKR